MGNSKGDAGERELRKLLVEEGFAVLRAAGSGSAPIDLPDLHVGDGGFEWAIEAKRYSGDRNEYLEPEEVEALLSYSTFFPRVSPRVACRWDYDTEWYVADPRDLDSTDTDRVVLDPDARDEDPWTPLSEILDLPDCLICGDRVHPAGVGPPALVRSEDTGGGVVHSECELQKTADTVRNPSSPFED